MVRWLLLVSALVATAACGVAATPPPDVDVVTGVDLGLTASDRLEESFSPGVWTAVRDGDLVRLRISFLRGDEGGITRALDLDFSTDPPAVVSGEISYYDAYADDRIIPVEGGILELQSADLNGVIAGTWIGEADALMRFWVDLSPDTYAEIEIGRPFALQPGGYAVWSDTLAFQYRAVNEDSRCPAGATCVWAGRVDVEGHVWDIEEERTIRLRGIDSAGGPMFGTQPSERLRNGLEISLIGLDDQGRATFVVEQSE